MGNTKLIFKTKMLAYSFAIVLSLWIVFWAELEFNLKLHKFGVFPQTLGGLKGILFSPFIHGDIKHLSNNSIPLFILLLSLFYFYEKISWKVLLWGALLTGLLTWVLGRPAYHIGASGIVYMLVSFLFFKGVFSKQISLLAVSFLIVFLYGSLIWYVFPIDPLISWEGHLSGLIVGFLFSIIFKKKLVEKKKYEWEKEDFNPEDDLFLQHFDEDGNFIENKDEILEDEENPPIIKYFYKRNKEEEK